MLNNATTRTEIAKIDRAGIAPQPKRLRPDPKKFENRRLNRLAWLVVDGQSQGFHCSLREFSSEGAHLTVSGLMGIPDHFSLYVEPDSIKFGCQVTLRKGNSVQVRFTDRQENMRFRDLNPRR